LSRSRPIAAAALTAEDFQRVAGVSRETLGRLQAYCGCLERWQRTVNLVATTTLADPWRRHFLDSAQLWPLLPSTARRVVDLGSGAGFPGMVLAILGAPDVQLIESSGRKAAFLQEVARLTATPVTIHRSRIESLPPLGADVVTARGCAPLVRLLGLAAPHLAPGGICLFLKGRNVTAELTEAEKKWKMRIDRFASRSDPRGVVVRLEDVSRETSR
jgi:16S rRNA (guanine527-N7)-methyltransferase